MPKLAPLALIALLALAACNRAPTAGVKAVPADVALAPAETPAAPQEVAQNVEAQRAAFAAAPAATPADTGTVYTFAFPGLSTDRVPMTAFRGKVILVVNTASKCGFTPQYKGLQALYAAERGAGLEIVGVPSNDFGGQEPGSAEEIKAFCAQNFGVTFPMAAKTEVTGENAHPLYKWAAASLGEAAVPQWNFHKILIGRDGRAIAAFPSAAKPAGPEIKAAVAAALKV